MPDRIVLDVSRLLSRAIYATPTGIDRVEMAYARGLLAIAGDKLAFAAVHPLGVYGRLPNSDVCRFLDETEERWSSVGEAPRAERRRFALASLVRLRPRPIGAGAPGTVYVQSSPHHLTRQRLVANILERERARLICLVHDLIPVEFPEYARAEGAAKHRARIATVTRLADGILTNSAATLDALLPWISRSGRTPLTAVAHLGTWERQRDNGGPPARSGADRPYFLFIGTIEPRKNHLLLLHIWREMAARLAPDAVPRLVLVGRRGWEIEQVVDILDRCPALRGCVEERAGLSDHEVRALLAGARALVLPSFAEGFGMPVAEAIDAGVPVICSDIPALREVGGAVPDYISPLDGPAWMRAILEYARPDSARRARQMAEMPNWIRPSWDRHFAILMAMIERLRK